MQKHQLTLSGKPVSLYLPENAAALPLFVSFLSAEEADALAALLAGRAVLLAVDEADWERSFTPWPAPKVFKSAPDFGGGADAYLDTVTEIIAQAERQFALQPAWRGCLGYSLAGLFAAYAAYRSSLFTRIAAVSASFWFDAWTDFLRQNRLATPPERAYFSVGSQEKQARNPRLAPIETAMAATRDSWQAQGVATHFELNAGGHFDDVPQRLAKAAEWLSAPPL